MEKEERQKLAVEIHDQKFNCCQSVLLACTDLTGMDNKTAELVGSCFASGMYSGEVCGAVTGGLMAIGACLPGQNIKENRPYANKLSKELQKRFREELGSIHCRDILRENGGKICDTCIACSAGIVNEIVENLRKDEQE